MKTNKKIEIGILVFASLLGIIFQTYMRNSVKYYEETVTEIKGTFVDKTINISTFTKLKVDASIPVEYRIGEPKVTIRTDENLLDKFLVEQKGNVLHITNENLRKGFSNAVKKASLLTVYNNGTLSEISNYENGRIVVIDSLILSDLLISTNGNSYTNAKISADNIEVKTNGNSTVDLSGVANSATVSADGNSFFAFGELHTKSANLRSNGNAGGSIYVSESIDADANGNGRLTLYGTPTNVSTSSRGNGRINKEFKK